MSSELKTLSKSEKLKLAEKHLAKYLLEIKRHFNFSDFQILRLLDSSSKSIKKNRQTFLVSGMFNIFTVKKSNLK